MLNHRVVVHAIDATPARWRGDAGSSPLDRARSTASSPRNDLVKNCRCTRRTGLISTQVGVCTPGDYESVNELIRTLPAGQARAVLLNCAKTPAYTPYKLLRMVQRHAKGNLNASQVAPAARGVVPWLSSLEYEFVLYDEADQTLHFEGTALRDIFDVLTQHPDYYVAPQRYEKGWGGIPRFVLQGNLSRTMNKCDPKLPRLAYT